MTPRQFERVVEEALTELPEEFAARIDNVAVVVQEEPSVDDMDEAGIDQGEELFGLYVGVPLTGRSDYHMVLPDRILIFQGPHERHFQDDQLVEEVRRTVIHEIAHHFGIDDDRLEALGLD